MITATLDDSSFAVVDVETTGFSPRYHHRIIEIAIVAVSGQGGVTEEWVTLVNPERDLGPTEIHGLYGADFATAPLFTEIAGDVLSRLKKVVVVGHNLRFDLSFLEAEFARLGYAFRPVPSLCTIGLSKALGVPLVSYKLERCCEHFGISLSHAHSALDDGRATAMLLARYLTMATQEGCDTLAELGCDLPEHSWQAWPQLPVSGRAVCRSDASRMVLAERGRLARIIDRLDITSALKDADTAAYFDLLDRVLEDRHVTAEEADAIVTIAEEWGLSRTDALRAQRTYLEALVAAALEDQVLSEAERRDLEEVTAVLGFDTETLDELLSQMSPGVPLDPHGPIRENLVGRTVCFTGELRSCLAGSPITREVAEELAARHGLTPHRGVTKKLDILVVADPHSLSPKAQKARRYGTRIMAESVFWQALGVPVE